MKNERAYDGKTSDVLRMVQEMDKSPVPEPEGEVSSLLSPDKNVVQGYSFKLLQQALEFEEALGKSCQDTERSAEVIFQGEKQIFSFKARISVNQLLLGTV